MPRKTRIAAPVSFIRWLASTRAPAHEKPRLGLCLRLTSTLIGGAVEAGKLEQPCIELIGTDDQFDRRSKIDAWPGDLPERLGVTKVSNYGNLYSNLVDARPIEPPLADAVELNFGPTAIQHNRRRLHDPSRAASGWRL